MENKKGKIIGSEIVKIIDVDKALEEMFGKTAVENNLYLKYIKEFHKTKKSDENNE